MEKKIATPINKINKLTVKLSDKIGPSTRPSRGTSLQLDKP